MSFAIHTWERQTHAANTLFEIDLDVDNDGVPDYAVYNDTLVFPTDLRNATFVLDLETDTESAFFLTTHYTNSGNTVLTFCGDQIGMDANDFLVTSMGAEVFAVDWYFTGFVSDFMGEINIVPLGERYFTIFEGDNQAYIDLPAESPMVGYEIEDFEDQLNVTERGLLWLFGPGAPADNEAMVIFQNQQLFLPAVRR